MRLRSGRRRLTTWDDVDAALQLCTQLYGKDGYSAEDLRRTTRELSSWRTAPKRSPLHPELLGALLPTVVQSEAYDGARSVAGRRD